METIYLFRNSSQWKPVVASTDKRHIMFLYCLCGVIQSWQSSFTIPLTYHIISPILKGHCVTLSHSVCVCQFCANDPEVFVRAALLAQDYCDAIDLNLGCPQMIAKRGTLFKSNKNKP